MVVSKDEDDNRALLASSKATRFDPCSNFRILYPGPLAMAVFNLFRAVGMENCPRKSLRKKGLTLLRCFGHLARVAYRSSLFQPLRGGADGVLSTAFVVEFAVREHRVIRPSENLQSCIRTADFVH